MPINPAGPWLEAVEGECVTSMGMAASPASVSSLGIEVRRWGRAVGIQTRRADVLALNRVLGVGWPEPASPDQLGEMLAWFETAGVSRCFFQVPPVAPQEGLREWLSRQGFAHYNNWVKLTRKLADIPRANGPEVKQLDARHSLEFGRMVAAEFGWPRATAGWLGETFGAPGWRHYGAFNAGGALLGVAVLQVIDRDAYFGFAATSSEHRGQGVQTTLLVHRLREAREAGCERVVVESAEEGPGRPAPSFRNLRRLGFEVAYLRANYLWKAQGSAA